MRKLSLLANAAGVALALLPFFLLLPRSAFAASPAPKPTTDDVEAWGRLVDTAFSSEQLTGISLAKALAVTGAAALREGKPALGEACLKRAYAAAPQFKAEEGNDYLRVAMELSRDPGRRVSHAPFILLYLDVAEAKEAKGLASQADAVKSLRADLATVKSPPPTREPPSIEGLRAVAAASERWSRGELERAKYRRTTGDLRSLGIAFEAYSLDNDSRYPAGGPKEIAKKISPAYISSIPGADAWGAPLRFETSADRKHFRIVSAGTDGSFETLPPLGTPASVRKRTVDDSGGDIVLEDGDLVQEWSEKAFAAAAEVASAAAAARPALDAGTVVARDAHRTTMASIRTIATAMESYEIDKNSYPAGWIETIESLLVPNYIMQFPRLDEWGTPFQISGGPRGKHYRIVSAGADGVFEPLPYLDPEAKPAPRQLTDPARDIVFEDGDFIQQLDMRRPATVAKSKVLPAPEPTPAEVAAWGRLLDAAFPPEPNPGAEMRLALRHLASEARRACVPALSEAVYERILGEKPEARRTVAGAVVGDAWAMYDDESRWAETAPFILLYLEQARRLRSTDLIDREDVAAIARARLLALDAAPIVPVPGRSHAAPSAETLRRLREASAARRASSEAQAPDANSARTTHGRALAEIRRVGDAIAQYRSDQGRFPDVGSRLVEGTIPGVYISKVPTHDPWGTEYRVGWSADRKHFRIVSAGADREFEKLGEVDPGAAWGTPSLATDPKRDIVFQDGVFLQACRDAR